MQPDDVGAFPRYVGVTAVPPHDEAIPRTASFAGTPFAHRAGRDVQDGLVFVVVHDRPGPDGLGDPLFPVDRAPHDAIAEQTGAFTFLHSQR